MPEQYDDMTPHARGAQENDGCAGEIGRGGSSTSAMLTGARN